MNSGGWQRYVTDDGIPYYHNEAQGRSQWERPAEFEGEESSGDEGTIVEPPEDTSVDFQKQTSARFSTESEQLERPMNTWRVSRPDSKHVDPNGPSAERIQELTQLTISKKRGARDDWGFPLPASHQRPYKEASLERKGQHEKLELLWKGYIQQRIDEVGFGLSPNDLGPLLVLSDGRLHPTLYKFVLNGISKINRRQTWYIISGAHARAQRNEYRRVLDEYADINTVATAHIDADLEDSISRSHPFTDAASGTDIRADGGVVAKARRILRAFACTHPTVGYVRSLLHIVRHLLMVCAEEEAFWILTSLVEDRVSSYHARSCVGGIVDGKLVEELLRHRNVTLFRHLKSLNVSVPLLVSPLLLSMYADFIPTEAVFRIWDATFLTGKNGLVNITVAVLVHLADELRQKKTVDEVVDYFYSELASLYDVSKIIGVADMEFREMPSDTISALRAEIFISHLRGTNSSRWDLLSTVCSRNRYSIDVILALMRSEHEFVNRGSLLPASEVLPLLTSRLAFQTTFEQFHAVIPEFDIDFRILMAQLLFFCSSPFAEKVEVMFTIAQDSAVMSQDRLVNLLTQLYSMIQPDSAKTNAPTIKALFNYYFKTLWDRESASFMRRISTHPTHLTLSAPPLPPTQQAKKPIVMADCIELFQCILMISDTCFYEVCAQEKRPLQFYRSRDVSEISPALLAKLTSHPNKRTETVKTGWMVKAGGKKADKSWLKRYFVLTTKELTYYEEEESGKAKGVIPVPTMQRAIHLPEESTPRKNKLTLQLVTTNRTFFFELESEKELRDWHGALCQVIRTREAS